MPRTRSARLIPSLFAAIAAGCTTTGTGFGSTASGASPATFTWRSSDVHSGTMQAMLSDGTKYSGPYFEITRVTKADGTALRFDGWYSGWDETDWNVGATPDYMAHYTGRVIADLRSSNGLHMRCRFRLAYPSNGMFGGGSGECRLPDGRIIDVRFPPG